MTFNDWASRHCSMFGLLAEPEVAMVLSWAEPLCEVAGFTVEELAEASNWMAGKSPPRFRTDHLRLLQDRIASRRLQAAAERLRLAEQSADQGRCVDCGNSGFIVVPDPRCIVDGRWCKPWQTCAVLCKCSTGRSVQSRQQAADSKALSEAREKGRPDPKPRASMGIAEYEFVNQYWLAQFDEVRQQRMAIDAADNNARNADRQRGPLESDMRTLTERAKRQQEN